MESHTNTFNEQKTNKLLNNKTKRDDKTKSVKSIESIKLIFSKENEIKSDTEITKKLAFDCEMVELNKIENGLVRISVVNEHGEILVNTLCKPPGLITDYRYEITGITPSDLENVIEYDECRTMILKLFKNKILIGHSIDNDFMALNYEHPKSLIRDTSKFNIFRNKYNQPHSLKYLTETHLKKVIQTDSHDSIEDARATLCLYKLYEAEIEKDIMNKNHKLIRKKVVEDSKKLHKLFGV